MDVSNARRRFTAGELLVRQGDVGECAYFLESGKVEILVTQPDGRVISIGTRGAGSSIGEMAIVDSGVRMATALAVEDGEALVITREELSRRLAHSDPVVRMFTEVIVARFREVMRHASLAPRFDDIEFGEAAELGILRGSIGVERLRLASDLRSAIANNELSMRYQPVIKVETGGVAGFEALLRWQHPKQGAISPDIFIPIAEESGQIIEITRWALTEACRALTRLDDRYNRNGGFSMSVNFSCEDLVSADFFERVRHTLRDARVAPSQVRLEITERVMMDRSASARDNLSRCRDAGFGIAIDDFGTGYSSLSYLNAYPIDTLKIDRSFIVDMHRDEDAFGLVRSIVGLAKTLRMSVVAEGVETADDLRTLRGLGCDYGQGYYFAKPLTEDDLAAFLGAWEPANVGI